MPIELTVDLDGVIAGCNDAAARALRVEAAGLIGVALDDLACGAVTRPTTSLVRDVVDAGVTLGPTDRWLIGGDGRSVAARFWSTPAPDADGVITMAGFALTDLDLDDHRIALEAVLAGWIAAGVPLCDVARHIAEFVEWLLHGVHASVGLVDGDDVRHGSAPTMDRATIAALEAADLPDPWTGIGSCEIDAGPPGIGPIWLASVGAADGEPADGGAVGYVVVIPGADCDRGHVLDGAARTVLGAAAALATLAIGRSQSEQEASFQADHDLLTGLANRDAVLRRMERVRQRGRRSGRDIAVFVIDVDRFRFLNDLVGHPGGDDILRAMADRLRDVVDDVGVDDAVVGRTGDNEFTVVATMADAAAAQDLAVAIVAALTSTQVVEDVEVTAGVSVGVAMSWHDSQAAALLEQATVALHQAKVGGGGQIAWFDPELRQTMRDRVRFAGALRQGIQDRELEVHYQPIVAVGGRGGIHTVSGAEALVRWRRSEDDLVPPSAFVPIAEDVGLIDELGLDVLEQAMAVGASLRAGAWPGFVMSVNVSARQLQSGLVAQVARMLDASGLDPAGLDLEITEGVLARPGADPVVNGLHDLGIGITIDDFGTGYSSLGYLRRYPVASGLKIDASFVRDLGAGADGAARAIVTAATVLGHSLGMRVTAEGVEDASRYDAVTELGCDRVQGFLVSRPVPVEDLEDVLSDVATGSGNG